MRPISFLVLALLLGSGCVSQSKYDESMAREKELAWQLEAAKKAGKTESAEEKTLLKKIEVLEDENKANREKLAIATQSLQDAKKDVDEELRARLAELQEKSPGKLELSPWGGVVLESGILFASGRHVLTKDGETALGPLVESLLSSKYDEFTIELSGHTDADPLKATATVYTDNHDLAAKRANSVRRFLIEKGVPATRIYLSAWGETRPLGKEKAQNRRVEIRLHHTISATELAGGAKPNTDSTQPASAPKDAPPRDAAKESESVPDETGDEDK